MDAPVKTEGSVQVASSGTPVVLDEKKSAIPSTLKVEEVGKMVGVAPVKIEFRKARDLVIINDEQDQKTHGIDESNTESGAQVRPRDARDANSFKDRKKQRGQNKNRKISHSEDSIKLCQVVAQGKECPLGSSCKFSHNTEEFLATKGEDLGDRCVNFELTGKCQYGLRCRYLKAHFKDGKLLEDEEKHQGFQPQVRNVIDMKFLQKLRKKQFDFSKSEKICDALRKEAQDINDREKSGEPKKAEEVEEVCDVPLNEREVKLIDFRNKTYLAPLTTVGNLPFRRVCKGFGVDITCGEMAMATSLLLGQKQEWSLVRRHSSEKIFGIQVTGNKPDTLVRCGQIFAETLDVDFVDINSGCPIDIVFNSGAGSALMDASGKLGRIIRGMNKTLNCPLTLKFRTGVASRKPTAHCLIPRLAEWGCAMGTLHGRSREQRYTKLADWDYISSCGKDRNMPLFGNGDVLSHVEYYKHLESGNLDGVMIGRGALIKPWIFEEIQRRDYWDISSRERLDIVKNFCDFGLEHWGSDTLGVNLTRRFLLEWMSFSYRYIPIGLLEVLPQGMNDRPPAFYGRDDLETLMASPNASDWVKISEMFLGKSPADFSFVPKHKSNSYDGPQG